MPVVSGGRRLTGWREEQVNGRTAWAVSIPEVKRGEWYFRQLFVNGSRRMRPRLPKDGFLRIEQALGARSGSDWNTAIRHGSDRFVYAKGNLRPWRNLQDVEVTVLTLWEALHLKIKEVDEPARVAIFDRNGERQIERTRKEEHRAFIFEHNIVYADGRPIVTDQGWGPENAEFARNLYCDASGAAPDFAGKTFQEWQAMGLAAGSVVGDPLFRNPMDGDFRLRPGSPAFALGFKEFDLSAVGPRR